MPRRKKTPEGPRHEASPAFCEAVAKQDAARPSQAEIDSAIPAEFGTEVDVFRTRLDGSKIKVGTRRDYKKIRTKNADGSLNKTGKNLIELHEKQFAVGADIVPKLEAGDFAVKAQQAHEVERKRPLDPRIAERVARSRGLEPVRGERAPLSKGGVAVRDEAGQPNLWRDKDGRLYRMAFVGTEQSARVETYRV